MNDDNLIQDDAEDPIVAEVRRAREELISSYKYDLEAFMDDMQRKTEQAERAGFKVASPAHETMQRSAAKKAG